MSTVRQRIFVCLIALVMVFGVVVSAAPDIAYAAGSELSYDKTNVMDDLTSSTVNGQPFDVKDYPYDEDSQAQIVNFVEYCYSYKGNMQSNYGLYVYVYNPQGLNISTNSKSNKIQMAVSYDSEGNPNDYAKFDLLFLSKSEDSNYKNLFYKFKVADREINGTTFKDRVNSNERRYDVSGVELMEYGKVNAVEYSCGGSYIFTGYAEGYGPDPAAKSTLTSTVRELETISLDVRGTNYRTESSSAGKDHQNQLESVYFSVDNDILERYGKLQKVKAEWYEYKTAPIVTISDKGIYDTLNGYVGKNIGEHTDSLRYSLGYGRNVISSPGSTVITYDWSYNVDCYSNVGLSTFVVDSYDICEMLSYLFYTGGTSVSDYTIPSDTLKQWIYGYDKSNAKGYLPIKDGQISADLFLDTVDQNRTRGYNCVEIDASEKYDLLSYTANHGFWDKVCDYGFFATLFGKVPTDENVFGIEPIYAVTDTDMSYDDEGIAKTLLISESDVDEFKEYYDNAKKQDKTTFLFRFAVTDYFAGDVDIEDSQSENGLLIKDTAYMAQETVFLDFDIIQLTFNRDGVYHVIPVVSSPVDVVGAITPPVEFEGYDWWKIVLAVILIVLLLIILAPVLPYILRAVVWLVCLPFRAIAALFKGIDNRRKRKTETKAQKEPVVKQTQKPPDDVDGLEV